MGIPSGYHQEVLRRQEAHYLGAQGAYDMADVSFRTDQPGGYHQHYEHRAPPPQPQPAMQPIYARHSAGYQPYVMSQQFFGQAQPQSQQRYISHQEAFQGQQQRSANHYHFRQPTPAMHTLTPLLSVPASSTHLVTTTSHSGQRSQANGQSQHETRDMFQFGSTQTLRSSRLGSATPYDSEHTMASPHPPLQRAGGAGVTQELGHMPDWWQLSTTRQQAWNQLQGA